MNGLIILTVTKDQKGTSSLKIYTLKKLNMNKTMETMEKINKMIKDKNKIIIAICRENGNGKILSVEIKDAEYLESVDEVVYNCNHGFVYEIENGEVVKPFDNDDKIRSHKNDTQTDNLGKLPISDKCKV